MYSYELFGGVLRSPVEFPELRTVTGTPTWTLERGDIPAAIDPATQIGDDDVYGEVKVRCFRSAAAAHQLVYDDTGRFDVSDGSLVTWFAPSGADGRVLEAARADLIGRVLAVALHQADVLTLHASAVSIRGRGIALLAPKMHGKSTLAASLVRGGGRLLSDDTVPVAREAHPLLRPGVHQLRLWRDSAHQLARDRADEATSSRKLVLDTLDQKDIEREPVPFDAAYVLVPARSGESASRTRLSEIQSTLALIEHSKLGPLLGGPDAAVMFEQAAAIARQVPVYLLRIVRDLDRLAHAAEVIRSWHAG
ncbi:MAG: hypothetical protein ACT4P7_16570 [Gemmatimonadaceae bacterium]